MEKLMIVKKARNRHIGLFGTTGSGKSNVMMSLFFQIQGKKIVIDVTGDYYKTFADPSKDLLFCPFAENSIGWNIFKDMKTKLDIINFTKSLISPSSKEPFWDSAAQTIVEAVMLYLSKSNNSKNLDLWEFLTDFEKLTYIKENDMEVKRLLENFTQEHDMKLTTQVLATVISRQEVRSLEYLSFADGDFNLREWVKNEAAQNTLYLVATEKFQNILLPLYRTIIDLISEELLELSSDESREITFFLDELPKLGKMPRIIDLLSLARKKGGGVVYSAQSYSQIEEKYDKEASTILNTTNTLFVMRMDKAEIFEEIFGKQDVYQYTESLSMGPSEISDRIGANRQRSTKSLVLASEISTLMDNEAYVKTIYPKITKVRFEYIARMQKNELKISDKNIFIHKDATNI